MKPEHVKPIVDYMNSNHKSINFSLETETNGKMPFLDVNVFHENGKFVTNVYRKKRLVKFALTSLASEHKFGLVYTLIIVASA